LTIDGVSMGLVWLLTIGLVVNIISSSKPDSFLWLFLFFRVFISFLVKSLFSFYVVFELSLIPILLIIVY
jgi:NADH:ubiquinone oxidoreductase subunit 4 (subunit M)